MNAWCALEEKKHHAKVALYGYRERSDVLQQVLEEVEMSLPVRGRRFVQDDGDNKFTSTWKVNNEGNQRWIIGEVFVLRWKFDCLCRDVVDVLSLKCVSKLGIE